MALIPVTLNFNFTPTVGFTLPMYVKFVAHYSTDGIDDVISDEVIYQLFPVSGSTPVEMTIHRDDGDSDQVTYSADAFVQDGDGDWVTQLPQVVEDVPANVVASFDGFQLGLK